MATEATLRNARIAAQKMRLVASLGDNKAVVLRNHGLLACGSTVGEAFMTMYYLDRA